ncbi:HK97 family phage prohead protease [Mycolicibacterium sphagni]|uniref:HK97 family phage prohead protease n=1 Tax=Mycolicibacterium sphagni TaxID=1786 RepID=UPI0021F2F318|nr:HK97 family phage prohead protease [Mycolicibacterium sphagni]
MSDPETITLSAYIATTAPTPVYGGPAGGGWIEQFAPDAFTRAVKHASSHPVNFVGRDGDGEPLARTTNGSLILSVDEGGLRATVTLPVDAVPESNRDPQKWGSSFRVKDQQWSGDGMEHREIHDFQLHEVTFAREPENTVPEPDMGRFLA